jgi:hypothetical protein
MNAISDFGIRISDLREVLTFVCAERLQIRNPNSEIQNLRYFIMSDEILSPLIGSPFRVEDRDALEEFMTRPDASRIVKTASFEEVFFTIKHIGLADCLDLLPLVTSKQVRGFIDLDCWRKDTFVRKPFMEWIAAFMQSGPEETVRALSGIDETLIALFLKDLIRVFEVERDDPPTDIHLIFTPESRFAVEQIAEGEPSAVGMMILDALFKYQPQLGSHVLTMVRYTTRAELEENAFDNKTRRLEAHGFVDYYEALSIYAGPEPGETHVAVNREDETEAIPGEELPPGLPAVFVDSLAGGKFLLQALNHVTDPAESERVAQELTALGNRILSANLVNLGELEGIRPALEEMRDFLTIGLQHLTEGRAELAATELRKSYVQTIFKVGFDQVARFRETADRIALTPGFQITMFDTPDQEFVKALRRFKPLILEEGRYRNFQSMADVERVRVRIEALGRMVKAFLRLIPAPKWNLAKTFNTATVQHALHGQFEAVPLKVVELETFIAGGMKLPVVEIPDDLQTFVERWWKDLIEELTPLTGKKIDPRYVGSVVVQ